MMTYRHHLPYQIHKITVSQLINTTSIVHFVLRHNSKESLRLSENKKMRAVMRTRIVLGLDKCHGIRFLISGSFLKAKKKNHLCGQAYKAMYGNVWCHYKKKTI